MRADGEDAAARCDDCAVADRSAGVVDERVRGGQCVEAVDRVARAGFCRVIVCGHDDAEGGAFARRGVGRGVDRGGEIAAGGAVEEREPVAAVHRNEDARLGIAETNVELEDGGDAAIDHEADEENATKWGIFCGHSGESRFDDFAKDAGAHLARDDRRGRVGPHAAGVRAAIPFEDALVILSGNERDVARAVTDDVEARFFAGEELFDDDRLSRVAELPRAHHAIDRFERFVGARRDDDPFAGGEPIGLHDERAGRFADVTFGRVGVVEDRVRGSRNRMARQEALHEALRSFELGGRARRAERADPASREGVDDAESQRKLGADDDEVGLCRGCCFHDRFDVVDPNAHVAKRARGARISRRDEHIVPAPRDSRGQGVLARTAADHQHRRPGAHGVGRYHGSANAKRRAIPRVRGAFSPMLPSVADEVKPPVAIRITRPFATEDEFLEREFDTLTRTSVVLLGAQPRPQGVILRFEIVLTNGQSVLRGEGRVVAFKPVAYANEPGLVLRFTRLDSKSKELVDRAAMLRDARIRASGMPDARKSVQAPAVEVPRPPPFAQPVVSAPFSAPISTASMPTSANAAAPEATIAQRAPSSRPPPLPPLSAIERGGAEKAGRRTVPPPLPSSSAQGTPSPRAPQPPLPPRFAELDIESTHVESIDSSALESERPSPPPQSFGSRGRVDDRSNEREHERAQQRGQERTLSSQPPSSEEPFKLSQPRISSLPPQPAHAPRSPSFPPQEPFALDPGAARALEAGTPSSFVPPPIFVPPPAAPLPYVPPTPSFELDGEDISMDDAIELSPVPDAPLSGPTYGQVFDPISVTSMDAAMPVSFEEESITNVDPEPPPVPQAPEAPISQARLHDAHEHEAPPPLPLLPFPPLPLDSRERDSRERGVANGHANRQATRNEGSAMTPPADRDALLERLRGRARALPAERITAILAKRV